MFSSVCWVTEYQLVEFIVSADWLQWENVKYRDILIENHKKCYSIFDIALRGSRFLSWLKEIPLAASKIKND